MEILKYKKKNTNEYIITLSDKTSLSFYDDTIINYNLLGKKNIDNELLKEIIAYNKNYKAYYQALKDISVKLRTEQELITRLKKKEYSKENIQFAIDKLKNQGYINSDLYLKSYIADQINLSHKGPSKIVFELQRLGFNETDINKYLEEYSDDIWNEKINKLIAKKEKSNHNLSIIMLKNKIKKDLITLGYNHKLIEEELAKYQFTDGDEALEKEFNKEIRKQSIKYSGDDLKNKIKYSLYKRGFDLHKIDDLLNKL